MSNFITIYQRVQALDLNYTKRDLKNIGRMMKVAFEKKHAKEPTSVLHVEDGKKVRVYSYPRMERNLIDKTVHRFYKKKAISLLNERKKTSSKTPLVDDSLQITLGNIDILDQIRKVGLSTKKGSEVSSYK